MPRLGAVPLAVLVAVSPLLAQRGGSPAFRFERVVNAASGPQRLAIDVPMLIGSQPFTVIARPVSRPDQPRFSAQGGLGDLRLFDGSGRDVPYLLVAPTPPGDRWVIGRVLALAATKKTSGFEVDLNDTQVIDRIRIDGLPPPFLKRVLLEASGDRQRWTVLLPQATLFDLPAQRLQQTALAFPRGSYRYLRATWDDTNSAVVALPASVSSRIVPTASEPMALTSDVQAGRVSSEPGRSRYRIDLPAPRLPIVALEPLVDAPYVFREATVSESRLSNGRIAPFILGAGLLRRVVRDQLTAASMSVPIGSPSEPQLHLSIADGDNPPLAITRVTARFAELPWIYFEHGGGPLVARWGDSHLSAPRYDLEAARPSIAIEKVPDASWGDVRALTPAVPTSPPTPMPNTGAPIEIERFRFNRTIPSGDAGLIAVPLDAAALAHSTGERMSFSDVRVADANHRQIPYLIEQRDEPLSLDLALERRDAPASEQPPGGSRVQSVYRVRLPYDNLPEWTLALSTNVTIFDRQVTLGAERPADARHRDRWMEVITSGRWVHADREKPAPALTFHAIAAGTPDLVIAVDEGDNSPLPIASARLLLPSFRLRLFRDSGASLRLLYGRDDIAPPSYDLALLSASVLGVPAREVAADPEQAPTGAGAATVLASPRVFWSVLVVAVALMLVVLVRLIVRAT